MATDQNIKNKNLALEIVTVYIRYMVHGQLICLTSQESFLAILHLFLTYKTTRKPLLGNVFLSD